MHAAQRRRQRRSTCQSRGPAWCRYPTPTLTPDGKIVIMGGTQGVGAGTAPNPTVEVFTPTKPNEFPLPYYPLEPAYLRAAKQVRDVWNLRVFGRLGGAGGSPPTAGRVSLHTGKRERVHAHTLSLCACGGQSTQSTQTCRAQNFYPFNYILPTGDMFNFCNRWSRILHGQSGAGGRLRGCNGTGPLRGCAAKGERESTPAGLCLLLLLLRRPVPLLGQRHAGAGARAPRGRQLAVPLHLHLGHAAAHARRQLHLGEWREALVGRRPGSCCRSRPTTTTPR